MAAIAGTELGDLFVFGALLSAFALVSSLRSATERATQCVLDYRKRRRLRRYEALTTRAEWFRPYENGAALPLCGVVDRLTAKRRISEETRI